MEAYTRSNITLASIVRRGHLTLSGGVIQLRTRGVREYVGKLSNVGGVDPTMEPQPLTQHVVPE